MNCSNCGTYNNPQSKFCIKCGSALNGDIFNQNISSSQNYQQPIQPQIQQPVNNVQIDQNIQTENVSTAPLNYFMYLIAILLKPFQCYKEEESKLNNGKTSFISVDCYNSNDLIKFDSNNYIHCKNTKL